MTKPLTDRAKVKRRWPNAHAYQWGPREWTIYADKDNGALAGIALANSTSQKGAWFMAASNPYKIPSLRNRTSTATSSK